METVPFRPGLEGVVAAQTEISEVDGQNGRLIYRGGHLINEVADRSYEAIAYLLWQGELPSQEQEAELKAQFAQHRSLNEQARAALAGLRADVDPMDALRTLLSAQTAAPGCPKPTLDEAVKITAVLPTEVAAFYRRVQGKEPIDPRSDLGHAANFVYMLEGKEPSPDRVRYLESYLVLLADHGLNASTFATRVTASTGSDLASAIVAGVAALKGPAHGGAATAAMVMLEKVGGADNAEKFVVDLLNNKGRLMGFGHRIYRTYDPRAKILKQLAEQGNPEFYAVAAKVEEVALRELLARHPERPNATNVDYYSAGVLAAAGLPKEFFTCVFAASRVAGWTAHVLEYMAKDGRILRPASEWLGPEPGAHNSSDN
ncbi:MAG: citrate synthase [Candidatus Dormibacter sp.]|uniref:citrate/2-methylcitrate synthase n=1 Tax=Candidatus Dormibacter sp. TaxID=2973982 RepID=UPI000DB3748B|nr:MAG: citrate synthase/methylcitrate synthase [Candidatus Dormibacteraeota bacterium]